MISNNLLPSFFFFFFFSLWSINWDISRSKCRKEQVINCWGFILRYGLYLDLRVNPTKEKEKKKKESYSLHKEPIGESAPQPSPPRSSPRIKCDVSTTRLSTEQRGYPKSDPGGDHYYVGCLGQTRLSLPESLISDHTAIQTDVKNRTRAVHIETA